MSRLVACAVSRCRDVTSTRHRFPNHEKEFDKFTRWVDACNNAGLKNVSRKRIYDNYRICQKHFRKEYINTHGRLVKPAVPELHLPTLCNITGEAPAMSTSYVDEDHNYAKSKEDTSTTPQESTMSVEYADNIPNNSGEIVQTASTSSVPMATHHRTPHRASVKRFKRGGILKALHIRRSKNLSPREKQMYQHLKVIQHQLVVCRKSKLSYKKRLIYAEDASRTKFLEKLKMDPLLANFFRSQVINKCKHPKGRRFTLNDKIMALALYKQSGKGYRLLSKMFALPSRKTMMALLNKITLGQGINPALFNHLTEIAKEFSAKEKVCTLIFDEMAIEPNLTFNTKIDKIEGLVCDGNGNARVVDHVQVFMIRGVYKKYKQPILYHFCEGTTKTETLVKTLKEVVSAINSCGLKIIATVCDQGTTNVAAINRLVTDTQRSYLRAGKEMYDRFFEIDGQMIVPLYDPPHLLKGIRNNLIQKDLLYYDEKNEPCIAKWQDIVDAYLIDAPCGRLRLMKKITDNHVIPNKIKKMKVSFAAQIFSHQVAAGITRMSLDGATNLDGSIVMSSRAVETANLLLFFNDLFDSVNGNAMYARGGNMLKCAVTKNTRHLQCWSKAKKMLESMIFISAKTQQKSRPPSLIHWQETLDGFKFIFQLIQKLEFQYFRPRTFNQDALENYFGQIRQHAGRNINPTSTAFSQYFKSMLVNNFVSPHSIGANCENDDAGNLLFTIQKFFQQISEHDEIQGKSSHNTIEIQEDPDYVSRNIDESSLGFVSGYLSKAALSTFLECCQCKESLLTAPSDIPQHSLSRVREYEEEFKLNYCSEEFFGVVKKIYNITLMLIPILASRTGICHIICNTTNLHISFDWIACDTHKHEIKTVLVNKFVRFLLHHYCNGANRILSGKDTRRFIYDAVYSNCKEKYEKSRKK